MQRNTGYSLKRRLFFPIGLVIAVTIIGTGGYYELGKAQGASLVDAFYMTAITLTTVGYREVIELNDAGKLFTIFIASTGIGSLFFVWGELMDHFVGKRLADPRGERRMGQMIDKLSGHIVITGLGRVGKQAALELQEAKSPFVVIDPSEQSRLYAEERGFLFISGDATDDAVLEKAGLSRAKGLIATTGNDASNLYIVLSARAVNPGLFIVARATEEGSIPKLMRAGANRAISPHSIGGRRLAHLILSPTVVDFFDTAMKRGEESLSIEDIKVSDHARVIGESMKSLHIRERSGASVLVVFRGDQVFPNPSSELVFQSGDRLLALGTTEQLDRLENMIG